MATSRQAQAASNTYEDEVAARTAELDSLRERIINADADRVAKEGQAAQAIHLAQLDAEKARLTQQLEAAESLASASGVEGAAAGLLASLESQAEAVTASVEAVPEPSSGTAAKE